MREITWRNTNRNLRRLVSLCFVLASCSTTGRALYTGNLRPVAGTCDPPAIATLEVRNGAVLFNPREGTISLSGSVGADGTMRAETALPGIDRKPYRLSFTATPTHEGAIKGRYNTPRCEYAVTFRKTAG